VEETLPINSFAIGFSNIEDADVGTRISSNKQSAGNDNFWVGYIQIAYQGRLGTDTSTENNNIKLGVTLSSTGNSVGADCSGMFAGGLGSLIYQETQRDLFAFSSVANDDLTAPHELGHQFGLLGDNTAGDRMELWMEAITLLISFLRIFAHA
jgi:hypothetical protein